MRTETALSIDPRINHAAQNARLGLINTADLSLLTGIEVAQLTSFAKRGLLDYYGEYHGKRFYNFEKIIAWLQDTETPNEARTTINASMKVLLRNPACPYSLEEHSSELQEKQVRIVWKEVAPE